MKGMALKAGVEGLDVGLFLLVDSYMNVFLHKIERLSVGRQPSRLTVLGL